MGFGEINPTGSTINAGVDSDSFKSRSLLVQRSFTSKKQSSHITIFKDCDACYTTTIPSVSIIVVGWVNFKTCNLCIIHRKEHEGDMSEILERVMGGRWRQAFLLSSVILMFVLGVAYFILMLDPFYTILESVFSSLPTKDDFTFQKFSYQWSALILIAFCFLIFSIKNLSLILKLNSLGIVALMIFLLFILATGLEAIFRGKVSFISFDHQGKEFPLFSGDVITICGIFALAFAIHNSIVHIIRYNRDTEKNTRDLGIGYIGAAFIYAFVGFLGGMAVSWRPKCSAFEFRNKKSSTLMDCFASDEGFSYYFMIIAAGFVLLHLVTVIPILVFISRNQALEFFYGLKERPGWPFWVYNLLQTACMLLAGLLNVFPSTLLAINGAVCGFGLLYIIPIFLHFSASFGSNKESIDPELLIKENTGIEQMGTQNNENFNQDEIETQNSPNNKVKAYGLYGTLFVFGFALMVLQLYQTFV